MPMVPKSYSDTQEQPGLLSDQPRPDASSILMAASLMHGMGRLGPSQGAMGVEHVGPKHAKAPKGSTKRGLLR